MNNAVHLLEVLSWQNATPNKKGQLAAHNAKKPKPFVPDFMKGAVDESGINKESEKHTVEDIKAILAQPRG